MGAGPDLVPAMPGGLGPRQPGAAVVAGERSFVEQLREAVEKRGKVIRPVRYVVGDDPDPGAVTVAWYICGTPADPAVCWILAATSSAAAGVPWRGTPASSDAGARMAEAMTG